MATIHFTKMHGAGNDYIYVDTTKYSIPDPQKAARAWSMPHFGIGSDGLVLIGSADMAEADYTMRIFNADGSEAMMCGNASRCIGKYLYEKGITNKKNIRLLTLSGIKVLTLHTNSENKVETVTVDMLKPLTSNPAQLAKADGAMTDGTLTAGDCEFKGTFVCMGNPHCVIFVDDVETLDVARYGSILEHHALFPERCNIEFAQVNAGGDIRMRVWERGSGITMACGTGACATAVAAAMTGRAQRKSRIRMDGGSVDIEWSGDDGHVYMSGPAAFAFEGDIDLPEE